MFRIIDKRSSGKTGRLMLLAKENDATIVCGNPHAMREKARAYGITGVDFISYSDFDGQKIGSDKKYFIDELETYLYRQSPHIMGYTVSEE